ncbi:MAG: hypothetical protein ACLFST_12390 [Spirochaetia bacterium]
MVDKNRRRGSGKSSRNRRKNDTGKKQDGDKKPKTPPKMSYPREPVIEKPKMPQGKEATQCPVCGKPVNDLYTAIAHRATKEPSHLNCVIKELSQDENLEQNESLCYLGGGSFGIVQKSSGGKPQVTIKKRIQYEEKESSPSWKQENKCEDEDERV